MVDDNTGVMGGFVTDLLKDPSRFSKVGQGLLVGSQDSVQYGASEQQGLPELGLGVDVSEELHRGR